MKNLSFSTEDINKMIEEFKTNLLKFIYEKKFSEMTKIDETKIQKPVIYFSMEAWLKMLQLVKACDKEIAWQATVEKRKFKNKENSKDFFYYIRQVYVYPQKVTGTFVDVDEVKYAEWSLKLEDEVYNSLRFQGHSHVNMGVSPSGTDLNTYQNFLDQLGKNDFYIFMILNKKSEFNIMVYDYTQNILFENKDCYVDVITPQGSLTQWVEESMKLVEHKIEKSYPGYYRYYEDEPACWSGNVPKPQGTPLKQQQQTITYANMLGYTENGVWHKFKDIDEALTWFSENPEYIDKAYLTPDQKQMLLQLIEEPEKTQRPKKRGRPPKGVNKV